MPSGTQLRAAISPAGCRICAAPCATCKPLVPTQFSTVNLVGVYVLGMVMASLGYLISPAAAREHWMLMRAKEAGERFFMASDFFTRSVVVQEVHKRACPRRRQEGLWGNRAAYEIRFSRSPFVETRASLTINGGWTGCRTGSPRIWINIQYPPQGLVTFLRAGRVPLLQVQEGLLHVLAQRGWYQPHIAVYEPAAWKSRECPVGPTDPAGDIAPHRAWTAASLLGDDLPALR
jgi:hypothetical protein